MPTATPSSYWPERMASAVSCSALAAVAQPLYTSMNGMPVSPSRPVTASGLSTSKLPPNANCTSFHSAPASASAARMASAPMSMADFGPNRPNGCRPTPMIATSSMSALLPGPSAGGGEGVGHDLGSVLVDPEGHDHQLHLHADPQGRRVVHRQAALDLH